MKMRLIDIENVYLPSTHARIKQVKLLDKDAALRWIGFAQQLLASLPTQARGPEHLTQGAVRHATMPNRCHPTAEFLECPAMTRQLMFNRLALGNG
jgi:hypothetical protein